MYLKRFLYSFWATLLWNFQKMISIKSKTPILAAQMPLVPLNMATRKTIGTRIIINRVLVRYIFLRFSKSVMPNFERAKANMAGSPRSINWGNEWESGKSEKTLKDSCSP